MAEIVRNVFLDVIRKNNGRSVFLKQNDGGSVTLRITLTNMGEKISAKTGDTVRFNFERPDGGKKTYVGSVNTDGTVSFTVNTWITSVSGVGKFDVTLIDDNSGRLTTSYCSLSVEPAVCSASDVSSDTNYDILSSLIAQVNALNTGGSSSSALSVEDEDDDKDYGLEIKIKDGYPKLVFTEITD